MEGIGLEALLEKLRSGNLDPKELDRAAKYQRTAFPDGIHEASNPVLEA